MASRTTLCAPPSHTHTHAHPTSPLSWSPLHTHRVVILCQLAPAPQRTLRQSPPPPLSPHQSRQARSPQRVWPWAMPARRSQLQSYRPHASNPNPVDITVHAPAATTTSPCVRICSHRVGIPDPEPFFDTICHPWGRYTQLRALPCDCVASGHPFQRGRPRPRHSPGHEAVVGNHRVHLDHERHSLARQRHRQRSEPMVGELRCGVAVK